MRIADRISRLGTETAFAVSAEAAAFAAEGNHVYPFHLGDMNLPTPSTVVEGAIKAPCATARPATARTPASRSSARPSPPTSPPATAPLRRRERRVQPGGKPVIGKFLQAVMNPGDEVLYPNPGYPIYESQIEYHGGTALPYGYVEVEDGLRLDLDAIERLDHPARPAS
jgi:aspartate/methionine/tyrosine aminotransferase